MRKIVKVLVILFVVVLLSMHSFIFVGADPPKVYDAESVYELAQASTFYIRVFRSDGTLKDVGSGFLINADGTAITAYHVVEGADKISCILNNGSVVDNIEVLSMDKQTDVAVLRFPIDKIAPEQYKTYDSLKLRQDKVRYGEKIFAMGYPMKETKIITEGIINTPKAYINERDRMIVSAQIASGMSGGPVIDKHGNVVGVISGTLKTMNNLHLVVGMDDIKKVMEKEEFKVKKQEDVE